MMGLADLFASPVFWAVTIAIVVAQGTKIFLLIFKRGQKFVWEDLFLTGNMPSAHTAIVVALCLILYLTEGFSPLFIASVVFASIVIRDAVGVRRTVGEESQVLTHLIKALKKKFHLNISRKMHENLGHQPIEVFVGGLVGLVSAILVYFYFV
jgi:uncharacterized protein